jgi:hypothetical protein
MLLLSGFLIDRWKSDWWKVWIYLIPFVPMTIILLNIIQGIIRKDKLRLITVVIFYGIYSWFIPVSSPPIMSIITLILVVITSRLWAR